MIYCDFFNKQSIYLKDKEDGVHIKPFKISTLVHWFETEPDWAVIGRFCLEREQNSVLVFCALGLRCVVLLGEVFRQGCQGTVSMGDAVLHFFRELSITAHRNTAQRKEKNKSRIKSKELWMVLIILSDSIRFEMPFNKLLIRRVSCACVSLSLI